MARRHTENQHASSFTRESIKERLAASIGGVDEADPVGVGDSMREVEDAVVPGLKTGHERRPSRKCHRRRRRPQRPPAILSHPLAKVG